jgi:hypothetical protein
MNLGSKRITTEFLLNFYDACLREKEMVKVAAALDMLPKTLESRIKKSEDLQNAQRIASARRKTTETLGDYVYKSLSPHAKEIWAQLKRCDGIEAVEALFRNRPIKLRQQLFIHALIVGGFDLSGAMRRVGIPRNVLENWKRDLEFMQLMEEITFHKKSYFEKQLIGLVEEKHPGAIIFVNRTVNADLGYSEKLQLEHSGSITNVGFNLDTLDLDVETRRKLLEAIRRQKEMDTLKDMKPVLALPAAA